MIVFKQLENNTVLVVEQPIFTRSTSMIMPPDEANVLYQQCLASKRSYVVERGKDIVVQFLGYKKLAYLVIVQMILMWTSVIFSHIFSMLGLPLLTLLFLIAEILVLVMIISIFLKENPLLPENQNVHDYHTKLQYMRLSIFGKIKANGHSESLILYDLIHPREDDCMRVRDFRIGGQMLLVVWIAALCGVIYLCISFHGDIHAILWLVTGLFPLFAIFAVYCFVLLASDLLRSPEYKERN